MVTASAVFIFLALLGAPAMQPAAHAAVQGNNVLRPIMMLLASITVDGDFSPGEWNPALERRAVNGDMPWGPNNDLINLYVSWDLTNLYIGVEGYSSTNNVFLIYIDAGSLSTGIEQDDYYPGFVTQGEGWDPDFVHAVCEMENGIGADIRRILGDGSTASVPGAEHASRWGYHNSNGIGGWEISIPWSEIGLEVDGWIRVAAGLGWATDKDDTEAPLGGGSGDELDADIDGDRLSLDNPVQIVYDADGDGEPEEIGAGADSVVVRFEYYAPDAASVNLAGDFNGWCDPGGGGIDTAIDPMTDPDMDGVWTIDRRLAQGYYEYKFVEDGYRWYGDPLNPDRNPDDNLNSVIIVYAPLVYYLDPMDGTGIAVSRPTVSASIAWGDGSTLDLSTLEIYIDDLVVAGGPAHYDTLTRKASFALVDSLVEGGHELKVSIRTAGGAHHADSSLFDVDLDFNPPVIAHTPVGDQPAGSAVTVSAVITDDEEIEAANLYYWEEGSGEFFEARFLEGLDDAWYAEIPASYIMEGRTIRYYITASDGVNTTREPGAGEHSFNVTADVTPPAATEHFVSPPTISPDGDGSDDIARISFRLSEAASVDLEIRTAGGAPVRRVLDAAACESGYRSALWDGTDSLGTAVADGAYRYRIACVDGAGHPSGMVGGDITVDRAAPGGKLKVVLLFHANQTVNYQGDTANDVCFNGLVKVLRQHPGSKFMLHFSGSLLHDLQWFNYRNAPSTVAMLRAGAADGQFEIVGSTYAQNIPYSTHMWDNDKQIDVQREVIERALGADPVSFWNAERCWKQQLVPLLADNGYLATWVESHILFDSGTTVPEHSIRMTHLGGREIAVFNDDAEMIGLLDGAIDSGNSGDLIAYLSYLHGEDTYRDFAVCYCEDAEATGLWDYEHGYDPQPDWDNLDQVLTDLEALDWIELTTFSGYLASRHPTEMLVPIVDGQANWMVGPSQGAGYADWFDYNERSPLLAFYRDFFTEKRERVKALEDSFAPESAAGYLVRHAIRNFVAHQFEFGCIGCGDFYCQDYHKMETLEAACIAAEYAASPVQQAQIVTRDANGDSIPDMLLVTPEDLFVFTPYGGRLLYWYDLVRGEQLVGNEIFMHGYYYEGWREHHGGGYNDDYHYMEDFVWNAPYEFPAALPYQRVYGIRKKCFNEFLSINGSPVDGLLNGWMETAQLGSDTLRFLYTDADVTLTKSFYPAAGGLGATYRIENNRSQPRTFSHRIENSLTPALIAVMDYGRESIAYYDGTDTSSVITAGTRGIVNAVTGSTVEYDFTPAPDVLSGRRDVFALQLNPEYGYSLGGGGSMEYAFVIAAGVTTDAGDPGPVPKYPYRLYQNYPNPFNPQTRIEYTVGISGRVDIHIYDVAGRLVRELLSAERDPGHYAVTWNGVNDASRAVDSGIYFCRMQSGGFSDTKKLILLR